MKAQQAEPGYVERRGFASMDRAKQREIASKGGRRAHEKGTAHEWTLEEAREAGRKGGVASHKKRREAEENLAQSADQPQSLSADPDVDGVGGDESDMG